VKHRMKLLAAAAAVAVGLSLTACSSGSGSGGSTSSSGTGYVPVQIGVGADAAYAPFFLADQQGLFKNAGLDVTLVPFASGGDALNAVSSGQVDLTQSSPATITSLMANNAKITSFVKTASLARYNKVVLRNGVDSAKDVKTFGYQAGLSQFMAHSWLEDNGVDPASVQWVSGSPQDLTALLQRGDIDGFFLWQPWPTNAVNAGTGHVVATAADVKGLQVDQWLATTQDWLNANQPTAKALVQVLGDAIDKIQSDPQAAAQAVETAVAIKASDAVGMFSEMDFALAPITSEDVTAATKLDQFFVSIGAIDAAPDLSKDLVLDWSWK